MDTTLTRRLIVSCVLIAASVAAAAWLAITFTGPAPRRGPSAELPELNQRQARSMLPVIDAYLDRDAGRLGFGGALSSRLRPREFCDATIVEIRPGKTLSSAGGPSFTLSWQVGIVMNCGEFARRGHTLLEGSAGYPSPGEVITLGAQDGRYQARSLDVGPESWDPSWVRAHFSPGAAALVLSEKVTAPDPVRQACRSLGLAPGTRAVEG